jgi:hypothetical protein
MGHLAVVPWDAHIQSAGKDLPQPYSVNFIRRASEDQAQSRKKKLGERRLDETVADSFPASDLPTQSGITGVRRHWSLFRNFGRPMFRCARHGDD